MSQHQHVRRSDEPTAVLSQQQALVGVGHDPLVQRPQFALVSDGAAAIHTLVHLVEQLQQGVEIAGRSFADGDGGHALATVRQAGGFIPGICSGWAGRTMISFRCTVSGCDTAYSTASATSSGLKTMFLAATATLSSISLGSC